MAKYPEYVMVEIVAVRLSRLSQDMVVTFSFPSEIIGEDIVVWVRAEEWAGFSDHLYSTIKNLAEDRKEMEKKGNNVVTWSSTK